MKISLLLGTVMFAMMCTATMYDPWFEHQEIIRNQEKNQRQNDAIIQNQREMIEMKKQEQLQEQRKEAQRIAQEATEKAKQKANSLEEKALETKDGKCAYVEPFSNKRCRRPAVDNGYCSKHARMKKELNKEWK